MTRDRALEVRVRELLAGIDGLAGRPMFGGFAWLKDGHLLCAVRADGVLVRLSKGNDAEALTRAGIAPMIMRGRPMDGWVRVEPALLADEAFAQRLIGDALTFVRSLPPKAPVTATA